MQKTRFGIQVHAIGYNAKASRFSGIEADRIKFRLFVLSGCVAVLFFIIVPLLYIYFDSPERLISHVFFSISRLRLQ